MKHPLYILNALSKYLLEEIMENYLTVNRRKSAPRQRSDREFPKVIQTPSADASTGQVPVPLKSSRATRGKNIE